VGGSLFGAGLTRIEGLDLHGQSITSISQLIDLGDGGEAVSKSILLSTEHRLISLPFGAPNKGIGRDAAAAAQTSRRSHRHHLSQSLLSMGELDIAALDSIIDDMDHSRNDVHHTAPSDNEFMTGALTSPRSRYVQ